MPNEAQRNLLFEKLGYIPTPAQQPIHESSARIKLVVGGERAGKSKVSAMELMSRFYEGQLYWLVAADYARTRAEYEYICEAFDKLGWQYSATKHVDPGEIIAAGGFRFVTKSAKDPRKLAMEAPDGILVCEASQVTYEDFLRLRGRLAEKRAWMVMSGTLESSLGWYPEMFLRGRIATEEFASFSLPTWTNTVVFPGGRNDPEIIALERDTSKDWFLERFGGQPVPPKGRVFKEFQNAIHTGIGEEYQFDKSLPVHLWVDPGYASAYAVLVAQVRGDEVYIVDEVYERNLVTSDIIKICKQRPWWNKTIGGAVDIAARQHQAMPAVATIWAKEAGIPLRSRKVRIQDGIERVKAFLIVNPLTNRPLLHINANCTGLISEMGGCPNPFDGQTKVYSWKLGKEGEAIGDLPLDRYNHGCKALAYGLIDRFGYSTAQRRVKVKFI